MFSYIHALIIFNNVCSYIFYTNGITIYKIDFFANCINMSIKVFSLNLYKSVHKMCYFFYLCNAL